MTEPRARVGIVGGSGLYDMEGWEPTGEASLTTAFGDPSDAYRLGRLEGVPVAFLARHGRGHRFLPGEINYRANILGFKQLGVERVLSASAVGSLRENIHPRDVVLPDQFIDRTRHRADTFFGDGLVVHVSLADPVCAETASVLAVAAEGAGATVHRGGTYLCMEGPQFSTRAESHLYRSWGATVIGMTNLQEARLCREAEMCYATLALVTDYDCWRDGEDEVVVDELLENLRSGARAAREAFRRAVPHLTGARGCACERALDGAVLTERERIGPGRREALAPLLDRLLGGDGGDDA